ncbi:MAG TPA: radical SAM protein [Thermoanaerobaculia bacterium]|jgi:hypothetical protein
MIGQPGSLKRVVELLRDPATAEKRRILAERWAGLDPALRLPGQGLGQKATGCGATVGIQPRCDFSCTGCYLGREANGIPALPTAAVLRQLDELRRFLGPKSNVQVTDGEVTLRPVEELVEILRYARAIGVIPMVMTHGDSFRRRPGLLERLMTEGGLTEVSIHVDITQRGRDGYKVPKSELELTPLRDEFAAMVRAARQTTGRPLRAAMTLTVTQENLPQVADVVRWLVRNRDAFGLVSFQPLAQVGRTRKNQRGVTADELWREVGRGTADFGFDLRGTGPMHFGHTECTRFVPLIALQRPGEEPRLFQAIRDEPEDVAIMQEFFAHGLGGAAFRDDRPVEKVARFLGMVRTAPRWMLGRGRRWADGRFRREAGISLPRLLLESLRGRLRLDGITLTSHHFMSPDEVRTPLGRERLAACVFRLPYRGEMVPMCQMNADGVRERFYAEILAGGPPEELERVRPLLPVLG